MQNRYTEKIYSYSDDDFVGLVYMAVAYDYVEKNAYNHFKQKITGKFTKEELEKMSVEELEAMNDKILEEVNSIKFTLENRMKHKVTWHGLHGHNSTQFLLDNYFGENVVDIDSLVESYIDPILQIKEMKSSKVEAKQQKRDERIENIKSGVLKLLAPLRHFKEKKDASKTKKQAKKDKIAKEKRKEELIEELSEM